MKNELYSRCNFHSTRNSLLHHGIRSLPETYTQSCIAVGINPKAIKVNIDSVVLSTGPRAPVQMYKSMFTTIGSQRTNPDGLTVISTRRASCGSSARGKIPLLRIKAKTISYPVMYSKARNSYIGRRERQC